MPDRALLAASAAPRRAPTEEGRSCNLPLKAKKGKAVSEREERKCSGVVVVILCIFIVADIIIDFILIVI